MTHRTHPVFTSTSARRLRPTLRPAVAIGTVAIGVALSIPGDAIAKPKTGPTLTQKMYEGFQRGELDRWDALVADDVVINSPGYWGAKGRDTLKAWGTMFLTALKPRIDLVETHEALDKNGNGRAFLTVVLNWKHVAPFFDLKPTGREGTSIETFLLVVKNGKVVRFDVADNTLDLAIYLWERGWPMAHNIHPKTQVKGITRR